MVTTNQPTNRSNNRVNIEQLCSWNSEQSRLLQKDNCNQYTLRKEVLGVTQGSNMWLERVRAKYTLPQTCLTHAPFTQSIPTGRCSDAKPVIQAALAKHTRSLRC